MTLDSLSSNCSQLTVSMMTQINARTQLIHATKRIGKILRPSSGFSSLYPEMCHAWKITNN